MDRKLSNHFLTLLNLGLILLLLTPTTSVPASLAAAAPPASHGSTLAQVTQQEPIIVVQPAALTTTLYPDQVVTQTLWISNTGQSDLTFTIHEATRTLAIVSGPALRPRAEPVVDSTVRVQLQSAERVRVLIYLRELADLSPAYGIRDWTARGDFVYRRLQETAERNGADLLRLLEQAGATPHLLLTADAIAATVDNSLLERIAGRPEVARIGPDAIIPVPSETQSAAAEAVEWNIAKIRADQAWSTFGVTGQGVTVALMDTGVMYNHPALVEQYRGNLGGGNFDHNYNWFDFANGQPVPYDPDGHGTFGMGLVVGDDGGSNQIGVAPGAKWIAVKTDYSLTQLHAAFDWMVAPTDLTGANPRPDLRPQVGLAPWNLSWGCDTEFQPDLQALRAADIVPVMRTGSQGPACAAALSPGDYPESFVATATDSNDNIASFSSRGPSCWGEIKPEVAAPGVNVRSSYNDGGYQSGSSGDSWSAAHLAGTAALVLSADPTLDVAAVEGLITSTAVCRQDLQCGGSACHNNVYGWGRVDAFEAVSATLAGAGVNIPWLSESPTEGTVPPDQSTPVVVTFDAAGLGPGVYKAALNVESNDPLNPLVQVPVTMTVLQPPPAIVVQPPALEASLYPDQQVTQTLWITDAGGADLSFTIHEATCTLAIVSGPGFRPRAEPVVDAAVTAALQSAGRARVIVYLREQADLGPAYAMHDWAARGQFVYERLRQTAERTGGELRASLEQAGAAPQVLLAANAIAATVDTGLLEQIAGRPEVAAIRLDAPVSLSPYTVKQRAAAVETVEWNIAKIRADQAWAVFGVTGQGVVVGEIDTGVDYTHPALVSQYRGNLGGSFDHNYNWFDFTGTYPGAPNDGMGHGTMGMGLAVGDDGGTNQIGVAPGAKWIAAKACTDGGSCSDADLLAAMDWMLAPTDLGGNNPRPDLRPQVVLNMWGGGSCDAFALPSLQVWRAAAILPVFSPGGSGPGCNTVGSPADLPQAFSAGATDSGDNIGPFSARGPSCYGQIKPEVVAPGVNVRSSFPGGSYQVWSGTSFSTAHLAGTAALVLSADPSLSLNQLEAIITSTALCREDLQCGGTPCPDGANNVYGWGRIDAFEAVSLALGGPAVDIPWLAEDPASGTLGPGQGLPIAVTFDSAGLAPGVYRALLDIESNDPLNPLVQVPVTMTVLQPPPAIVVQPPALQATLHPDEAATQTLWISDTGLSDLTFAIHETTRTLAIAAGPQGGHEARPYTRPRAEPVVDAAVTAALQSAGRARVIVYLREQADLGPAYAMRDWAARGQFVYERLRQTAERTGGELRASLEQAGATPQVLLAANAIAATVDAGLLAQVAGRPEVAAIVPDTLRTVASPGEQAATVDAVEWNIARIGADQAWATFGITGTGAVVGEIDTGGLYTHAALVQQYRGNLGGSFDHNYNWFDFVSGQSAPYDDNGHGTFGLGVAVGDDGGTNQIGVAPGARWVAAKACTGSGSCSDVALLAAADWMLAPTDLGGNNPRPDLRPQVVLNMWGGGSCDTFFQAAVQAWRAAGMLPVFAGGGSGPNCGTVGSPGDLPESFAAGSTDASDTVPPNSARGPSCWGKIKPDVTAPGVNIHSSWNNGGYLTASGSSWAAAHLAGTAALVWSADPALDDTAVESIITSTALCRTDLSCGGSDCANNVYGWGRIDAFEAVSLALGGPAVDIPWLAEDPTAGTVAPGEALPIAVTFDAAGLAPGVYQAALNVESNDPLNPLVQVPVTLTVLAACDPVHGAGFTWTPLTPTAGQVVTFTAWASGSLPITYTWGMGDGTHQTGQVVGHAYPTADTYTVVLTATNCATATAGAVHTITVAPIITPCEPVRTVAFGWTPPTPTVGQVITLTAWADSWLVAAPTPPITFTWNFGDGSLGSGAIVTHSYTSAGSYTVTVAAQNGCGSATISDTLPVLPLPAEEYTIYLPLVMRGP
jgi:subtilisin family serine protease